MTLAQGQSALLALIQDTRTAGADLLATAASAGLTLVAGQRGLQVYQAHAGYLAERVLATAYPVLTQVISAESMAGLARQLWRQHPPQCGDASRWGAALAGFLQHLPEVAELPWLPDLARLEWILSRAESAQDVPQQADSLSLLAEQDPARLHLQLAAGCTVLRLGWNVLPLWQAHQGEAPGGETGLGGDARGWAAPGTTAILLWRPAWRPQLASLTPVQADFLEAVLAGRPLLEALELADPDWADWLPQAWHSGLLRGVRLAPEGPIELVDRSCQA